MSAITTTRPKLQATSAQRTAAAQRRARIDQAVRLDSFARAVQWASQPGREVIRRAIKTPGHARRAARAAKIGGDR
jgi:hypothetical protein